MKGFTVEGLTAGYAGKNVVENLNFEVKNGEVVCLLGSNGGGKTTLLKSICGILPHRGRCLLDEMELEKLSARQIARKCGYIPQRSGISIDISALDVVLMGFNPQLGLLERPTVAMRDRAKAALEQVGLGARWDENYLHLSEGQKQLCILARTLVSDCRLLLLDEPESALDFRFRYRMMALIQNWVKHNQGMALVALHDPMLALNVCDGLLLLKDGQPLEMIHPETDALSAMEASLQRLYGSIQLMRCEDRWGKSHLVMLKEQEIPDESSDENYFSGR